MAVMTANAQRPIKLAHGKITRKIQPMAGYTNFAGGNTTHSIFKGSIVVFDVSDTDGYCRAMPLSSTTNIASDDIFGGVAAERQDVTSSDTADGSVEVSVYRNGVVGFAVGSITITDIGAPAYASDDQTVTTTSSNNLWIGTIEGVDSTYVYVNIQRAFMLPVSSVF